MTASIHLYSKVLASRRLIRLATTSTEQPRRQRLSVVGSTNQLLQHHDASSRLCMVSRRYFVSSDETKVSSTATGSDAKLPAEAVSRSYESDHDDRSSSSSFIIPGAQTGGRKLAIVFTCNVCETRSAKQFTEKSYTHGVVIVRCPGCENLHLIADRLGYFGAQDFDLSSIVEKNGHTYKTINDDNVYELSLEELMGKDKMEEFLREAEAKPTP